MTQLVVVTGASTGIGAATARELARQGFHVLAGVRREQDAGPGVEPVILDITEPAHIEALRARVADDERPLRALVNNAGIQVNAPVETLPMDQWRWTFEVNLFGHVAVTQALLPALLRSGGRVINISSVGGRAAMPTYGAYAGTKFALEAVSDSLRREVEPLGMRVVVIEPGGVRTEIAGRGIATANRLADGMTPEQTGRYGGLVHAINSLMASGTGSGVSAETAARVIATAVTSRRPRTRYTVGRDAAALTRLTRILPDRALDRLIATTVNRHRPAVSSPVPARARSGGGATGHNPRP
ncbi:SDR family oxidoreductase [Actinoplanes bogorensis]|uniref:SDR family oxidoreductase n=1 Tax=Paractinoplanes bogorensis TaxID=1610840 RepID=A0ABS5YRT8_9ACTN|nr:SDR family oxidoreductase [Actinoplanes bogorensis]MBU2664740.1 SDR family oxidoreductase [Actinoplanes bogorensis]